MLTEMWGNNGKTSKAASKTRLAVEIGKSYSVVSDSENVETESSNEYSHSESDKIESESSVLDKVNAGTNDEVSVAFLRRRNNLTLKWLDNIGCDTLAIHNIRLLENPLSSHCGTPDFSNLSEILGRIKELY